MTEKDFSDAASAATWLADEVARLLREGIAARGKASLAVSGGKSPVPFFHALRVQPMAWENVTITLVDERWVAQDEKGSNDGFVREHLLQDAASSATFIGLKSEGATPNDGLEASMNALAAAPRPFDVVIVGMGEDGHTCSLFPGMPGLAEALDPASTRTLVQGIAPVEPFMRISMTIASVLDSSAIFLPIQGEAKQKVLAAIKAGDHPERFPIASVLLQTKVPVTVQSIDG